MASDATQTYAVFLYRDIQWSTANLIVGFDSGMPQKRRKRNIAQPSPSGFILPESALPELALGLDETSNFGMPGAYIFRLDSGQVVFPPQGSITT